MDCTFKITYGLPSNDLTCLFFLVVPRRPGNFAAYCLHLTFMEDNAQKSNSTVEKTTLIWARKLGSVLAAAMSYWDGAAANTTCVPSADPEAGKSKDKVLTGVLSGKSPFLHSQVAVFSLCPHMVAEGGSSLGSNSMRTPLSWSNRLPKAPHPNAITLNGIKI